jgi:predicted nucleic acid-binding protein
MILLDTNVLSEIMRPAPEPKVLRWLDAQPDVDVWISAITVAEVRLGIELLAGGKRRQQLASLAQQMFEEDFAERCLPFDALAASEYASIVAKRTRQGSPISVEDAQIAAIAVTGGLVLATRNTRDFAGIQGLTLVNPWIAESPKT